MVIFCFHSVWTLLKWFFFFKWLPPAVTSAFTTDDISGIWAKTREDQITRSCDSNAFLPAEKRNKCVRAVVLHQDAVTSGLWMQRQTLWVDYHVGGLNYYGLLLVAARNGLSAFTRSHSCFSNTKRKWNIWQQLNSWNLATVWWRNEAPALLPARPVGLSVWLKHTDVSSWWMCLRAAE